MSPIGPRRRFMAAVRRFVRRLIRPVVLREPNFSAKHIAFREEQNDFSVDKPDRRERAADLPVPPRNLWVALGAGGYGATDEEYLEIGRRTVERFVGLLEANAAVLRDGARILDFGCASGRLTRWFADRAQNGEVWGVDISAEHVIWCQQNLSPPFHFCTTTTAPHLPFEDRYFDLVFAGSVFTHIDELADAWFLELRRILVPGGHLLVTINDKHSIDIVRRNPEFNLARQISRVECETPLGDFAMASISRSYTLYDREYLTDKLQRVFDVVATQPEIYGFQTGLLLRKR